MKKADKTFLFDLLETPSPTGFEAPGQRKWVKHVKRFSDSVDSDAYGTAWATLKGSGGGRSVMLEAHADEIGYIIKYIADEGFLHLDRIGGSDCATARGRTLRILGDRGEVPGIVGNTAIHIRENRNDEKAPKIDELYVDVGASDRKGVEKLGLRVGHPAVYADSVQEFANGRLVGRALDNRIGGFIIAKVLEKLSADKKKRPAFDVVAVNAVQEEIGGLGAKMVSHRLMPDLAICLDVTHATDTPGIKKTVHGEVKLGGGPTVTHGTCNHPNVVGRLMGVADKKKIPLQHESSSRYSGTDTDKIYPTREGIPSALVSLPLRYMHSVVELVDLADVGYVIDLLSEFVLSLEHKDDFAIKL